MQKNGSLTINYNDNDSPRRKDSIQHKTQTISSRKRHSTDTPILNMSHITNKHQKPVHLNLLQFRVKQMQNSRLMKRINQIRNRKNKQYCATIQNNDASLMNQKAREVNRIKRKKQIQYQNDMFVERMVRKLNSHKGIFQNNNSNEKSAVHKKQGRHKNNMSNYLVLPSIFLN